MEDRPQCPAHPEAKLQPTIEAATDQFFGTDRVPFNYLGCAECGALVLSPRPAPKDIGAYYAGYYTDEILEHLRKRAARGKRVGGAGRLRALGYVKRLKKYGVPLGPEVKLLDVGCGLGAFAGTVQRLSGVQAKGVDFSPECQAFAKDLHGLDVDQGELIGQQYPDAHFDLVTSWHYMEHVYNPRAELQEMARITRPGGWLMLETPTPSALAKVFKKRWLYLMPPTHLYHYQPHTLKALVEEAGFEDVRVLRPWFPGELAGSIMFALGVHGFVPKVFGPGRPLKHKLLTAGLLAQMVYDVPISLLLTALGRSGLLRIFARRKNS